MKEALERVRDLASRKHSITMRMVYDICNHALDELKFCLNVEIPEIKDGHCNSDCPLVSVTKEGVMRCLKAFGIRLPKGYMQPGTGCPRHAGEKETE